MMKILYTLPMLVLAACPPVPVVPGGTLDDSACGDACYNLEKLGCKTSSGRPLTDIMSGQTCEIGCKIKMGRLLDLHPACVAKAPNCEEANLCSRR